MSLYFIADIDTARRLEVDLVEVVRQYLMAGGRMLSLRGNHASDQEFLKLGKEIGSLVFAARGRFLVHRRADLARLLVADGLHLPAAGLAAYEARSLMGPGVLLGRSCHADEEVRRQAKTHGFLTLGPVFESISKEGYGPTMSLEEFAGIAGAVDVPVYALGGVRPQNVSDCLEAGAGGVAVLGGILGADSPFEATESYLRALESGAGDRETGRC